MSAATISEGTERDTLYAALSRAAELEARLDEVHAAVQAHYDDLGDGADARLYRRVLGPPTGDFRVDDPNDWPEP